MIDREVELELETHRRRVGRELTAEEIRDIHRSPTHHGWIRHCKANHEHNSKRLRAEGWVQVETAPGVWEWRRAQ